jgi:hypothetical protein
VLYFIASLGRPAPGHPPSGTSGVFRFLERLSYCFTKSGSTFSNGFFSSFLSDFSSSFSPSFLPVGFAGSSPSSEILVNLKISFWPLINPS